MTETSRHGESAAPNTLEKQKQEPGKTPDTERRVENICSEKATRGAGGEEGHPHKTQRRQDEVGEITFGTFNVRTAAVNDVNGTHRYPAETLWCKWL